MIQTQNFIFDAKSQNFFNKILGFRCESNFTTKFQPRHINRSMQFWIRFKIYFHPYLLPIVIE